MKLFRRGKDKSENAISANTKSKRMLVVGSDRHSGVRCVQWNAKSIPNVADFDAVILNPATLAFKMQKAKQESEHSSSEEFPRLWRQLQKNVSTIKDGLLTLLESGGEVYVVASPKVRVDLGWGHPFDNQMTNYWWVPLPFDVVEEIGETQQIDDIDFARYMEFVKQWSVYFELPHYDGALEGLTRKYGRNFIVELTQESIACNRYGKQIATRFRCQLYETQSVRLVGLGNLKREKGDLVRISGPLILLPAPTEISDHEAVNVILEDFFGRSQKTLPPHWIENIDMPGVRQIQSELENKRCAIERIQTEIQQLEQDRVDLEQYKQLLFETGARLEEISKQVFRSMGCCVLPPDVAEEDFILKFDGQQAIVEVKGNTKSISLSDLTQLGRYRGDYAIERGSEIKGVLIGNAWRLLPPSERDEVRDRVTFPENVISYAEKRGITLVSTVELFRAYCAFLEGRIEGEEIIRRIFGGSGITSLSGS